MKSAYIRDTAVPQGCERVLARRPAATLRCSTGELCCTPLQAEAQKQLEEQQEKQARALKAVQRAQKLLATHASMTQQRAASAGSTARGSSGSSSGGSTHREAAAAGVAGSGAQAGAVVDAAELEADVQLTQLRLVMRGMLQELRALDAQSPGEQALPKSCWPMPGAEKPLQAVWVV